ncbi:unnamed protein product [Miscanthus lutarioriparius]|uniref:non-specific serine/threonine protein kinase n=1 Tax=Miscanthus lutarioriparius TaxID=422564 RepID=A0A811MT24_9POAL|nr:unnamed protein product [Miscanthus lutarioriparius]
MLILVFLLFSSVDLRQISGATTDTLTLGQSLPWNETLVSKGGNFELGLFSPGKSKKHYIGIWFRKVSKQTVVWVANRDRPILEPSASRFTLSDRGELLLHATPSNTLLWSSNASSPSPPRTTVATLQDDGNLVVRSNASASSSVAWQSFDHPTDTWLPGARLGYDRARGVHSFLTSWTDSENPAPATFSMEIDQRGQAKFDLLAGGTHQYWTTGVWDGEVFENVPEMRSGYFDGVPYAPNASVNFFSYKNRVPGIGNFVLEVNGQMQRRQWSPEAGKWILFCSEPHDGCDVYGSCGPFGVCRNTSSAMCECPAAFAPRSRGEWKLGNTASGCVRRTKLDCPNDGFLKLPYAVELPGGSAEAAGARSDKTCALSCLRDCSCTAYAYDAAKCLVWKGELVNLKTLPGDQGIAGAVVLHVRVAASEVPPPAAHHSWRKSMVIISSSVSAVVLLLAGLIIVVAVAVVLRKRRGKGKAARGDVVGLLDEKIDGDANVKELERVCKVACWCIQDEEGDRPTMGLVVQQLEGVVDVGLPPIPSRLHMLAMMNNGSKLDTAV